MSSLKTQCRKNLSMDYNKIEDVETYIDAGIIKYEVEAFYMKDLNGRLSL